ncbi:hypothetical protein BBOH_0335 [Bifidobacterium bohemicum DSM 22767]|uniref:Uncharacterized protein n=1 Tax=Bifidobacterium bohemicum DSM 22767 TaxID=1437606 RepID=A0A086ZK11_9BIFI|nr:hypothetical protein BBOH_0335 [Bifidobacterium bohemicum DSM 22767]
MRQETARTPNQAPTSGLNHLLTVTIHFQRLPVVEQQQRVVAAVFFDGFGDDFRTI